jgi:hypothetical protein
LDARLLPGRSDADDSDGFNDAAALAGGSEAVPVPASIIELLTSACMVRYRDARPWSCVSKMP